MRRYGDATYSLVVWAVAAFAMILLLAPTLGEAVAASAQVREKSEDTATNPDGGTTRKRDDSA